MEPIAAPPPPWKAMREAPLPEPMPAWITTPGAIVELLVLMNLATGVVGFIATTSKLDAGDVVPIPTLPFGNTVRRAAFAVLSTMAKDPDVNPETLPDEVPLL